jgi:predicted DNA-binding antitoxin AbrB/MazE fold protein
MEGLQVEAVYAGGVLKVPSGLPLSEGQKVTITIHPAGGAAERLYGLVPWKGHLEEFDRWLADSAEGAWGPRNA